MYALLTIHIYWLWKTTKSQHLQIIYETISQYLTKQKIKITRNHTYSVMTIYDFHTSMWYLENASLEQESRKFQYPQWFSDDPQAVMETLKEEEKSAKCILYSQTKYDIMYAFSLFTSKQISTTVMYFWRMPMFEYMWFFIEKRPLYFI